MSGRNFSLTKHLSDFINKEVISGRHQNPSEVVREALRRYEDDVAADLTSIAVLEMVVADGAAAIERGEFTRVGGLEGSQKLLDRLNARAARKAVSNIPRHG